ncbi:GspH/FimT family pseudopilin [Methylobacillus gramineus]|uniref:GspH/FimT family pseudopilin n=1 Tax=Methylobacillus gramineus TaxID=755169 RepID=UPI001CFFF834|nr:GspH/FimT family pseudopilin [Methylobacillus gramineus]MCB5185940.1 GspH/FimT family pseudopilin [Methylobacillus gramineus]
MKATCQKGLTLVELVITMSIVAILLAVAIPSFRIMLVNFQIRSAADGLNNGLQLARAEAIRRNANVIFTLGAGPSWSVGCQVVVADSDSDGVDDCPEVIQEKPSVEGATAATIDALPAAANKVTFNGLGRVTFNNDGSNVLRQLDMSSTQIDAADARNMRILIRGGSVHFCDPNVTTVGDPRVCA